MIKKQQTGNSNIVTIKGFKIQGRCKAGQYSRPVPKPCDRQKYLQMGRDLDALRLLHLKPGPYDFLLMQRQLIQLRVLLVLRLAPQLKK